MKSHAVLTGWLFGYLEMKTLANIFEITIEIHYGTCYT